MWVIVENDHIPFVFFIQDVCLKLRYRKSYFSELLLMRMDKKMDRRTDRGMDGWMVGGMER